MAFAHMSFPLTLCLAACYSTVVVSLRAPGNVAGLDGPLSQARGSTGTSNCTVSSSRSMLGMRRQQSTCGKARVLAGLWNFQLPEEETVADIQLRCYIMGTSVLAKEGEQGECRIPRTKRCHPEQPGLCRAGTTCQRLILHRRYELEYVYHVCRE
mmetsp:Transcript_24368/g.64785  ORF Transcript_24368/g.64785 Transcript_24368/m.64785 type:complete len:155 (-) Transcript_24368:301-765(-)